MQKRSDPIREPQAMRRLLPKSRMGLLSIVLVALWALKSFFASQWVYEYLPWFGLFLDLLPLLLAIPALYYLWKISKYARNKILWKIRRRLILAHIFIGAIPVVIVILIFYFSVILFYYQLSYFLVFNQIGTHSARIHAFNLSLRDGLQQKTMDSATPSIAALREAMDADARYLLGAYPSAAIILSYTDRTTNKTVAYANQNSISQQMDGYSIPSWLKGKEFNGLVVEDTSPEGNEPRLLLRSFVQSTFQADLPFNVEVSVPFDRYLLGRLKAAFGQDMLLARQSEHSGMNVILPLAEIKREGILESTLQPEDEQSGSRWMWPILLIPTSWTSGMELNPSKTDALMVEVSLPKLLQNLFRIENKVGKAMYDALKAIVAIFLLVEIASIIIGIMLTKSITSAVHNLDRGTQFVKRGDFGHRIIVRSEDQLGALAASFNQMTEYVQHLVKELVQKERLEREVEIAREVQERLFPNQAPQMKHLDVAGVCLPARMVSGDYYDFLPLGASALGMAVGDICGKGISAALLMANLQATLRSNVMNLWAQNEANGDRSVARIVERMNYQIYGYTTDNKFATFFYALYDDAKRTITYCNAGHNPPLHFNRDGVRRLCTGGTVVGIFEDSRYDQETVQMTEGDLFVAYTDGIVESINEYGEEFGENRLIQIVEDNRHLHTENLKERILEAVQSWKFAEEQEDDMTLVIAKIVNGSENTSYN